MANDKHHLADMLISQKFDLRRSSRWPVVERNFKQAHPKCAACGTTQELNVHHIFPFPYVVLWRRPGLEFDSRNLITLCTLGGYEHHLLLGHLSDYESYNPEVLKFVKADTR